MQKEAGFKHDKEYHEIVNNKEMLKKYAEELLYSIIDELTLGIIFDIHRKYKTKSCDLVFDGTARVEEDLLPNTDIFRHDTKTQDCECPNCSRPVDATGLAKHLQICMGLQNKSRASRRQNNYNNNRNNSKDRDSTSFSVVVSDSDDDIGGKRRRKKLRNGNKKEKGTPKKNNKNYSMESGNIDVEGDDDADVNLRIQDNSNHSSPADAHPSSSKKRDKIKNKKIVNLKY